VQTRKDQMQAHSFVVGRLVSGLLRAEPDAPTSPLRRFNVSILAGLILGALMVVGCGVLGIIFPANNKQWQEPGTLVVEKETGARYVFIDGELRPVLNYTSARLILGGEPKSVVSVSRNSLKGTVHGMPLGIPNAPDSLPDLKRGDGANWQVCSGLRTDVTGTPQPYVTVRIGGDPTNRPLDPGDGILTRAPTGQVYLAWNNRRMLVPSASALTGLGYAAARQYPVGLGWLNSMPAGPDLAPPDVPGRGTNGQSVGGKPTVVGQVFKATGLVGDDENQFFVMRADGLSPLTQVGAALALADPKTAAAYRGASVEALPLNAGALSAAPRSQYASIDRALPARPPQLVDVGDRDAPCVRLRMKLDGALFQLGIGAAEPATGPGNGNGNGNGMLADRVTVEPGAGLLVRDQPAPGVTDGAVFLVVDIGVRFPLIKQDVVANLGYRDVNPVPVPGPLLSLLPVGPVLDPDAARASVPVARQ
jgi:type VII secretion protein EccB